MFRISTHVTNENKNKKLCNVKQISKFKTSKKVEITKVIDSHLNQQSEISIKPDVEAKLSFLSSLSCKYLIVIFSYVLL